MNGLRMTALSLLFGVSVGMAAEVVIIVNPANVNALSEADIYQIYLGKTRTFPDGSQAIPVTLREGHPLRREFLRRYVGKSETQLKTHWSQLIFTGKGVPPQEVDNEEALRTLVATNPNIIGYISAEKADSSVKVIKR